jgi:hypothetical protein
MKTAIVDDRHRIRIPDLKPGQVFAWEDNGKGQITLLEVQPKAKEARKTSILDGLKPFTKAECEECWGPNADPEWDRIAEAMSKVPVPPPEE